MTETLKESLKQTSSYYQPMRFGESLETRRWFVLLTVCLVYIASAIGYLTFNATSGPSKQYFHTDDDNRILYFTDVSLYVGLILSYVGCWVAYKYFKLSVIATAFFTSLACWIRWFAGDNYVVALLCQTLIGVVATTLFGFANLVPDRWFGTSERFAVNTISVFSNYVGWALGTLIPCIIIQNNVENMPKNLFFQACIITVPFILSVIFIKENPKVPPSYSALVKKNDEKGFFEEMKILLKSPLFIGGSLCFGMVLGLSNSIPTTNSLYMAHLNLSDLEQGYITLGYVATGMVPGLLGAWWIDKKGLKDCDLILKVLFTISFVSLLALGIVFMYVEDPSMFLILACNCVLGIGFIGFMPFACSSIIESNFPIQEAVSTNGMNTLAQLFSVLASHLSTAKFVGKGGFGVLAAIMLPCWVYMMFFYKTQFKRQEADEKHQDITKEVEESQLVEDSTKNDI